MSCEPLSASTSMNRFIACSVIARQPIRQKVTISCRSYQHIRLFTQAQSIMAPLTSWDRLVRYVSKDGDVKYGEPIVEGKNPDIDGLAQRGELRVKVLHGTTPFDAKATGEEDQVKQLLGPLTPKDVPIVRCIGINYKTHSECQDAT